SAPRRACRRPRSRRRRPRRSALDRGVRQGSASATRRLGAPRPRRSAPAPPAPRAPPARPDARCLARPPRMPRTRRRGEGSPQRKQRTGSPRLLELREDPASLGCAAFAAALEEFERVLLVLADSFTYPVEARELDATWGMTERARSLEGEHGALEVSRETPAGR